jgi:pyridoxine 5-phosphate synthase
LFIDPDPAQLEASREAGAGVVELHTGCFADAVGDRDRSQELERIRAAAKFGTELGLTVHAGHGLHYENVQAVAAIGDIRELNIGHSIIARAIFDGLAKSVADMKRLMLEARQG